MTVEEENQDGNEEFVIPKNRRHPYCHSEEPSGDEESLAAYPCLPETNSLQKILRCAQDDKEGSLGMTIEEGGQDDNEDLVIPMDRRHSPAIPRIHPPVILRGRPFLSF